jgi:outer membrane lipoprotein-sorting protein
MKRIFVFVMICFAAFGAWAQESAEAIVRASRDRVKADTTESNSRISITRKNGSTSEQMIRQFSKDGPEGARTVFVFLAPRSVEGTRFLTRETKSGVNEQWIVIPSRPTARRLAASEGSNSFAGDFSNDDAASSNRKADLDTHTLLREEKFNGKDCYVIESKPKDSSYQYSKMVQWIGKDDKVAYKAELYDKKGTHIKTLETLELRNVQGRLSAVRSRMSTLKAGTSTTMTVESLRYDRPLSETIFTTEFLEKGEL